VSGTNVTQIVAAMDALPASNTNSLPLDRQLHISGIRTSGCFHSVYDLEFRPKEITKLFEVFDWPYAHGGP
jgi:hypothetical protein